jgi:phosphate starvation-inducible protein PhoH
MSALDGVEGIGVTKLEACDIVRNPIISKILCRLDSYEDGSPN